VVSESTTPANDALQVPYKLGNQWKPMQPDFIFFTRNRDGDLQASIFDPHGAHLSDALPKLKGLADFAAKHEGEFLRIEAIAQIDKKELRMLDLRNPDVRLAVREVASAEALYRSNVAVRYE
jgi:type III restriction enzyme